MILLFKFHKDNIKTLDLDDNYTFKKISIKLNKLGYCGKNVKFIYLGNILIETQKISELVGITNNSYISVIQCKERLVRNNYLRNLCNIFTGLYSGNNQLSNFANLNINTDILNENFNNQILDNTLSIEDSDNSIQEIENSSDNISENNSSDNISENNSSDNISENNSSDNISENNSDDNELLEIDISNSENIIHTDNSQENFTNQIENIIDNSVNNIMTGTAENNIQLLVDMGYLDQNLNQMALDLNHNNINLAIEWMEQFR